jgi:hypothetical protein
MPDLLETLPTPEPPPVVTMFERLAADPNVPVDKLEKLIELQERVMRHNAEAAFNASFSAMQHEMPTVPERGRSLNGPYPLLEDIIEIARPVLHKHGFAVTHHSDYPEPNRVRVTAVLTHRDGHAITSEFVASADTTGNKNAIQALGSAISYGRRYTLQSLLLIATRNEDDNGRTTTSEPAMPKPDGYDEWLLDLSAAADNGKPAVDKAWTSSKGAFKAYLTKADRKTWEAIKARAARV